MIVFAISPRGSCQLARDDETVLVIGQELSVWLVIAALRAGVECWLLLRLRGIHFSSRW
jgi:hypothetical protein